MELHQNKSKLLTRVRAFAYASAHAGLKSGIMGEFTGGGRLGSVTSKTPRTGAWDGVGNRENTPTLDVNGTAVEVLGSEVTTDEDAADTELETVETLAEALEAGKLLDRLEALEVGGTDAVDAILLGKEEVLLAGTEMDIPTELVVCRTALVLKSTMDAEADAGAS